MPRGLPSFDQVFDLDQNQSNEPKSRQLTKPRDLKKVHIEAVDEVFSDQVAEVALNPESVTEQKSANWVKKYIPGQSDPLLQWINGTERVVSFDVLVTKDKQENPTISSQNEESFQIITNEATSASAGLEVSNTNIPVTEATILKEISPGEITLVNDETEQKYWSLSIQSYLDYYRSLLVPRTSERLNQFKTPPLIKLTMGSILGPPEQIENSRWVLASYTKNITRFNPDLEPIEATVSLSFIEYITSSQSIDVQQVAENLQGKRQEQVNTSVKEAPEPELIPLQPVSNNQQLA